MTCYIFIIFLLIYLFLLLLTFSSASNLEIVSIVTESGSAEVSLPDVVVTINAITNHYTFSQGSGLPLSFSGTLLSSMCDAYIAI